MTTGAARFTGTIPENYDEGLGPHIFADYASDLATRVAGLRPSKVLELAAGTGIVSRKLRDALADDCELIISDLNPPMLEVAKLKFKSGESVSFEQVDATELRFEDALFDVVACQFGIMFFPDKDRSYSEVFRVLKPGGAYIFNVWDSWQFNPFAQRAHEVVATFFPDDPPGFYKVPFSYHDTAEIEEVVLRAGFSAVTIERVNLISKIQSAEKFATGIIFGNPLFEEIESRGGDANAIHAALSVVIETELGSEMPLQAIVVHASKS